MRPTRLMQPMQKAARLISGAGWKKYLLDIVSNSDIIFFYE